MNMIGHHTRGKKLVLPMIMRVENTFQNNVAFSGTELTLVAGRKCHHIFSPWALEMREASFGVFGTLASRRLSVSRERAGNNARGGRGPSETRTITKSCSSST